MAFLPLRELEFGSQHPHWTALGDPVSSSGLFGYWNVLGIHSHRYTQIIINSWKTHFHDWSVFFPSYISLLDFILNFIIHLTDLQNLIINILTQIYTNNDKVLKTTFNDWLVFFQSQTSLLDSTSSFTVHLTNLWNLIIKAQGDCDTDVWGGAGVCTLCTLPARSVQLAHRPALSTYELIHLTRSLSHLTGLGARLSPSDM